MKKITYKDAGVDKEAGYEAVKLMREHVKKTFTKGVLTDIGGFGGLFSLGKNQYEEPVLVSGTDGVGTKLMVAFKADVHHTIGEDCVAMCVNDILCQGAKPLFFLDYVATGKLKPEKIADIVKGIANGCVKGESALIGGETAEMPGLYSEGEYDVAGFAVGVVDRKNIIDGSKIKEGDVIIGLPSNGLHSNGFSLVRKILFDVNNIDINTFIPEFDHTLAEELLRPTSIYTKTIMPLLEQFELKGMCHITGGGFYENIPRVIPKNLCANVTTENIPQQAIFKYIQEKGNVETKEMYSTFNMGVGFILVVSEEESKKILNYFQEKNETAFYLGKIEKGEEEIIVNF